VAFSIYSLRANYFVPYKEDFRDAIAYVAEHATNGDCNVVEPERGLWGIPDDVRWAWSVYRQDLPPFTVHPLDSITATACRRVWLIMDYSAYGHPEPLIREVENTVAQNFVPTARQVYYRVQVNLYERKSAAILP
jgi:hypothetical protein